MFNGESAKLDAERRQQQEDLDSSMETHESQHPHRQHKPSASEAQPSYSNEDQVASRSLEAESDAEPLGEIRSALPEDRPISFEIHEEAVRLPEESPARFGVWSHSQRSQLPIGLIFISCILVRIVL
jgi:hypothetical protein